MRWRRPNATVVDLASDVDLAKDYVPGGYPHHYFMHKQTTDPGGDYDLIQIARPARPRLPQRRHDQRRLRAGAG